MSEFNEAALIVGASSGIATALINHLKVDKNLRIFAVSQHPISIENQHHNVQSILSSYNESDIVRIVEHIATTGIPLTKVFVFNGRLHDDDIQPEKKLEDFDPEKFLTIAKINVVIPSLWLKHLVKVVNHSGDCFITLLSARVGSISDNSLGGWYSYRSSKAALNMMIKTAAIEYGRRAKRVSLVAFHPGTTDTPLSKPFQGNVKPEKLFTPDFVADKLQGIVNNLDTSSNVHYLDWAGKPITW